MRDYGMEEFEFTLKFALPNATSKAEEFLQKLCEAGCDDAIIGVAQTGVVALMFNREARSALEAKNSAIQDVKSAIPKAKLIDS